METVRVLFLSASGESVGGGHVLRDLALSAALRERGAVCGFAVESEGRRLLGRFGAGLGVEVMARASSLVGVADAWGADAVVIDDYRLDATHEAGLPTPRRLLVAVDDLADRPHLAGLLIDPSFGREPASYRDLLPSNAMVLSGAQYALLRPAFAHAVPIPVRLGVGRVFVGFGLADPGGVTLKAVRALLPVLPGAEFDVVMGAGGESLPGLYALAAGEARVVVHVESDAVEALMGRADMAVGAGGASTWERFRLGLPSLCVIVADNQRALSRDLADRGLQFAVEGGAPDFALQLAEAADRLAGDQVLRRRLSEAGRRLCDGQGAGRCADAILNAVAASHL